MQWTKWIVLAAAGFAPTLAFADEPADPTPQSIRITVHPLAQDAPQLPVHREGDEAATSITLDTLLRLNGRHVVLLRDEENNNASPHPLQLQLHEPERGWVQLNRAPEQKREKGAYLGVSATPAPMVLRKQLGLSAGMGLVVDFVMPDSPAAKAGLKQYDIIQKLDDQLIVNQEQLAVLVRSHKPGEEVKLTLIHDGKPVTVTAKLDEHELEPLAESGMQLEFASDAIRQLLPEPHMHPIHPGDSPWTFVTPYSVTLIDGDHSFSVATDQAGHKTLTVKDKAGKENFKALIDTKEQRDNLPGALKAKLDSLERFAPQNGKSGGGLSGPEGHKPASATTKSAEKDSGGK